MPHKHKRKRDDQSGFDLAPGSFARPLPASKIETAAGSGPRGKKHKQNHNPKDDTPAAFKRIMQFKKHGRHVKGLDEGKARPGKKAKQSAKKSLKGETSTQKPENPTILPGERLSDFAARVDQAIPISGLIGKGNKDDPMLKERQTRMEKKMKRMQATLREEETRRKEKEEEARDGAEEDEAANSSIWDHQSGLSRKSRRGTSQKGSKKNEPDLWAKVQAKQLRPSGLHDVVEAPPDLRSVPREKFKVKNNAKVEVENVPNAAGSLRKREELGDTRKSVIESYRKLMEGRRR